MSFSLHITKRGTDGKISHKNWEILSRGLEALLNLELMPTLYTHSGNNIFFLSLKSQCLHGYFQ